MDTSLSLRPAAAGAPKATLVLVPSLGTTTEIWHVVLDGWDTASHLDVVLVDLPGHGAAAPQTYVEIPAFAADVARALEETRRTKDWIVAGVSMGGAVAVEIAAMRPRGLRAVASFNSALRFGTPEGWERIRTAARAAGTPAFDPAGTRSGWFTAAFAGGDGREVVDRMMADLDAVDLPSYLACCDALERYDGHASAAAIKVPGIAVGGRTDASTAPERMREIAAAATGIRFAELPGAHLAVVEDARLARTLLEGLLSDVHTPAPEGTA